MGPPQADSALREAISMGADEGFLVAIGLLPEAIPGQPVIPWPGQLKSLVRLI